MAIVLKPSDYKLLSSISRKIAEIPEAQELAESLSGQPVVLEAKNGKNAISLDWLIGILPKLGEILPLILALFTGGATLTPQLIVSVLIAVLKLFGVSQLAAIAMMQIALDTAKQEAQASEQSSDPPG